VYSIFFKLFYTIFVSNRILIKIETKHILLFYDTLFSVEHPRTHTHPRTHVRHYTSLREKSLFINYAPDELSRGFIRDS